jgi:hypothetical protein
MVIYFSHDDQKNRRLKYKVVFFFSWVSFLLFKVIQNSLRLTKLKGKKKRERSYNTAKVAVEKVESVSTKCSPSKPTRMDQSITSVYFYISYISLRITYSIIMSGRQK